MQQKKIQKVQPIATTRILPAGLEIVSEFAGKAREDTILQNSTNGSTNLLFILFPKIKSIYSKYRIIEAQLTSYAIADEKTTLDSPF